MKQVDKPSKKLRLLVFVGGMLMTAATATGIYYLRVYLAENSAPPKKVVQQQITLVAPPPPPPPPPEPPKPEVPEEKIPDETPPEPEPTPEPAPNEAPAGEDLGLDADGSGGGDGFGLVGRKGGRDFLAGGGGAGSYTNAFKEKINALLSDDEELKYQKYKAILRFWVSPEGVVERFEVSQFNGDPALKKRVEAAMASIKQFGKPPDDLAQPINWQVISSL
ncbi:MAG TPA: hypothetical protein PKD17_14385 [Cellvibrionaceae bacterium]|nr:hypothetical protein [Cellvibrionaceae bacterium]HNG60251.1 hypothetical protein [Cellvibrionaceae bacterium]